MRIRWLLVGIAVAAVAIAAITVAGVQPGGPLRIEAADTEHSGRAARPTGSTSALPNPDTLAEPRSSTTTIDRTSEEPLHRPNYGPDLDPSGASVTFNFVDARGVLVQFDYDMQRRLFRKQGKYWLACPKPMPESGTIGCYGLEPGDYELEYECELWGRNRLRFSVAKGEQRTEHLRMDTWRRVICFEFRHADGTLVSHVRRPPKVSRKHPGLETVNRDEPNLEFLSRGPRDPNRKEIRFVERPRRGGRWSEPELYPTDDGRFYVEVMAGMPNVVEFELDPETWGTPSVRLEDDFTGEQWDPLVVTLQTPADFAQRVAAKGPASNWSTPGHRFLATPETPQLNRLEERFRAPPQENRARILLDLQSDPEVVPRVDPTHLKGGDRMWQLPDGRWWQDVIADRPVGLIFSDERYFRTARESLKLDGRSLVELSRVVKPRYLVLHLAEWKHTLGNRFHQIEVRIQADDTLLYEEGPREALGVDPADRPEEEVVEDSGDTIIYTDSTGYYVHPPSYPMPADGVLRIPFDGEVLEHAAKWRSLRFSVGPVGGPTTQSATIRFEPGGALEAISRPIRLEPRRCLAFRAVGPSGEGLPCVDGILMDAETDSLARATRECCVQRDPPPFLHVSDLDEHNARLEQLDNGADPALLREMLGENAWAAFGTDAQRLWFARNACWYDFRGGVSADDHGFSLKYWPSLVPGRRYVLYLWSQSRDDLHPDARIVFEAREGITDLGAIRLPAYSE